MDEAPKHTVLDRQKTYRQQIAAAFPAMSERHISHRVAAMLHMERLEQDAIEARHKLIRLFMARMNESMEVINAGPSRSGVADRYSLEPACTSVELARGWSPNPGRRSPRADLQTTP